MNVPTVQFKVFDLLAQPAIFRSATYLHMVIVGSVAISILNELQNLLFYFFLTRTCRYRVISNSG